MHLCVYIYVHTSRLICYTTFQYTYRKKLMYVKSVMHSSCRPPSTDAQAKVKYYQSH